MVEHLVCRIGERGLVRSNGTGQLEAKRQDVEVLGFCQLLNAGRYGGRGRV